MSLHARLLAPLAVVASVAAGQGSAGAATPVGPTTSGTDGGAPLSLVVTVPDAASAGSMVDRLRSHARIESEVVAGTPAVRVDVVASDLLDVFAATPRGATVELDVPVRIARVSDDPAFPVQSSLATRGVPQAWDTTVGSADVVIAVIDTGVDATPDLGGRVLPGIDLVDEDGDAADAHGHGTHVATVAAARGDDGFGIAGVCWTCRILPVRVLDANGTGSLADVAAGIVWAAEHGADVINLSLGGPGNLAILDDAVQYALDRGVVVLAAAGNQGTTNLTYPAATPGAIAVAGSTSGGIDGSSNRGAAWVDVAAPWCNVATGGGDAVWFCGTSSATPFAAGVAALLRAARPDAGAHAVRSAIEATTDALATPGASAHGMVSAGAAMSAIVGMPPGTPGATGQAPATDAAPNIDVSMRDGLASGTTSLNIDASDDRALAAVSVAVDGRLVGSRAVGGRHAGVDIPWDTGDWADGVYVVRGAATDAAGHVTSADGGLVRVDNHAPLALVAAPPQARVGQEIEIKVLTLDGGGIKGVLLAAGGRWVGVAAGGGLVSMRVPVTVAGTTPVAALTVDEAGRFAVSNVVEVRVTGRTTRHRR